MPRWNLSDFNNFIIILLIENQAFIDLNEAEPSKFCSQWVTQEFPRSTCKMETLEYHYDVPSYTRKGGKTDVLSWNAIDMFPGWCCCC